MDLERLTQFATMATGSGWGEGDSGGTGHMGILNGRAEKFNVHSAEVKLAEGMSSNDMTRKSMMASCDNLRKELFDLANGDGKIDSEKLGKICDLLNVDTNGEVIHNRPLLTRKIVAKVINLMVDDKDDRDNIWNTAAQNAVSSSSGFLRLNKTKMMFATVKEKNEEEFKDVKKKILGYFTNLTNPDIPRKMLDAVSAVEQRIRKSFTIPNNKSILQMKDFKGSSIGGYLIEEANKEGFKVFEDKFEANLEKCVKYVAVRNSFANSISNMAEKIGCEISPKGKDLLMGVFDECCKVPANKLESDDDVVAFLAKVPDIEEILRMCSKGTYYTFDDAVEKTNKKLGTKYERSAFTLGETEYAESNKNREIKNLIKLSITENSSKIDKLKELFKSRNEIFDHYATQKYNMWNEFKDFKVSEFTKDYLKSELIYQREPNIKFIKFAGDSRNEYSDEAVKKIKSMFEDIKPEVSAESILDGLEDFYVEHKKIMASCDGYDDLVSEDLATLSRYMLLNVFDRMFLSNGNATGNEISKDVVEYMKNIDSTFLLYKEAEIMPAYELESNKLVKAEEALNNVKSNVGGNENAVQQAENKYSQVMSEFMKHPAFCKMEKYELIKIFADFTSRFDSFAHPLNP